MWTTIRDPQFLTEFYSKCCHRAVHGCANQDAIALNSKLFARPERTNLGLPAKNNDR